MSEDPVLAFVKQSIHKQTAQLAQCLSDESTHDQFVVLAKAFQAQHADKKNFPRTIAQLVFDVDDDENIMILIQDVLVAEDPPSHALAAACFQVLNIMFVMTNDDEMWVRTDGLMKVVVDALNDFGEEEGCLHAAMALFRVITAHPPSRSSALSHGVVEILLELISVYDETIDWERHDFGEGGQGGPSQGGGGNESVDIERVEAVKEDLRMYVLGLWTHKSDGEPIIPVLEIPFCPKEKDGVGLGKLNEEVNKMAKAMKMPAPQTDEKADAKGSTPRKGSKKITPRSGRRGSTTPRGGAAQKKSETSEEPPKAKDPVKRAKDEVAAIKNKKIPEHVKREWEIKKKAIYWAREVSGKLRPGEPFPEPRVGKVFKNKYEVEIAKQAILESRQNALKQVEREVSKADSYVSPLKRGSGNTKATWNTLNKVSQAEQEVQKTRLRNQTVELIGAMHVKEAQERDKTRAKREEAKKNKLQMPLGWEKQGTQQSDVATTLGEHVVAGAGERHGWEKGGGEGRRRRSRLNPSPRGAGRGRK